MLRTVSKGVSRRATKNANRNACTLIPTSRRALSTSTILNAEATPSATTANASSPAPSLEGESKPAAWTRPLEPGVLSVYDEALAYIKRDSEAKKSLIESLKKKGKASEVDVEKLEVASEVNLPEVRWGFENRIMDLSKPVYRHLLNQSWREKGRLDRLMERVHLMKVVPDVLPAIRPTVDVRVDFSSQASSPSVQPAKEHSVPVKKLASDLGDIAPEHFLLPYQTLAAPTVTAQTFHTETRLYTLVMIDPDVPDTANESFKNYVHWLVPNIPLSAHSAEVKIPADAAQLPYIPPHPQYGSPSHRYVVLLLPQPSSTTPITISATLESAQISRDHFDLRAFIAEHGLLTFKETKSTNESVGEPEEIVKSAGKVGEGEVRVMTDVQEGGGLAIWREQWDSSVTKIYETVIGTPEPRYHRLNGSYDAITSIVHGRMPSPRARRRFGLA